MGTVDVHYEKAGVVEAMNKLKEQRDIISDCYSNHISQAIQKSAICIRVSGLSFEDIQVAFSETFSGVCTELDALIDVLETKVIPSYSALGEELKKLFNKDFAEKMSQLVSNMPTGAINSPTKDGMMYGGGSPYFNERTGRSTNEGLDPNMMYTGGSPNFDERTGRFIDEDLDSNTIYAGGSPYFDESKGQ